MQRIGNQMQYETRALKISPLSKGDHMILDLCMAPGGYLKIALQNNPQAKAVALTLPVEDGGHHVLLEETDRAETRFADVTMLAADMGVDAIPPGHPDADKFLPRQLPLGRVFDLVLCDGQVLRLHERSSYREKCEAVRLKLSQLVLGLERLKPGGTLVMLTHKPESWHTVQLMYALSKFARVQIFKPTVGHAKRSSFYLLVRRVQSDSPECLVAIERWKDMWKRATFPGEGDEADPAEAWEGYPWTAEEIIDDFGPELLKMSKWAWATQVKALEGAPFIRRGGAF